MWFDSERRTIKREKRIKKITNLIQCNLIFEIKVFFEILIEFSREFLDLFLLDECLACYEWIFHWTAIDLLICIVNCADNSWYYRSANKITLVSSIWGRWKRHLKFSIDRKVSRSIWTLSKFKWNKHLKSYSCPKFQWSKRIYFISFLLINEHRKGIEDNIFK